MDGWMDGWMENLSNWIIGGSRVPVVALYDYGVAEVTEVEDAFLTLHDFPDTAELVGDLVVGGLVVVVGVMGALEFLPPETIRLVVPLTKLAIGGPGKVYGAPGLKTFGSKIPGSLSL
jgi:hypothetical protein